MADRNKVFTVLISPFEAPLKPSNYILRFQKEVPAIVSPEHILTASTHAFPTSQSTELRHLHKATTRHYIPPEAYLFSVTLCKNAAFTLPYSDIILEVPKRKRTYKAPFNLKAKISSATKFSELKEQLREMTGNRNLAPNTRRLCERMRDWTGEYCDLKPQRLRNEKANGSETITTALQSGMEKIRSENGLAQAIIDYNQDMVHKWFLLEFGDLLAADLVGFQAKD